MVTQFAVHAFRVVNPAHHPHSQLPPGGVETTGLQNLQARHEGCLSALLQRSTCTAMQRNSSIRYSKIGRPTADATRTASALQGVKGKRLLYRDLPMG